MRVLALVLLVLLCGCPPSSTPPPPVPITQPPPPKPPEDPPPVTEGNVSVVYENGLRIIVKRIPSAELVATQLYILGGARFRTKDNAGVEMLALRTAVTGGTTALDKDAFAKALNKKGSSIHASSQHAYSVISTKALAQEFDSTFDLMVSAFLTPAMPDSEIELHRERMLVGIKRRGVTPDSRLRQLMIKQVYAGHPFEHLADGNEDSVGGATPTAVRDHLKALRVTSRLQLVVAGNVEVDKVRALVKDRLAKLPRGSYASTPIPGPKFEKATLSVTPAELPTNYIEASFMGPTWNDPEFAASILALRVLRTRVFEEVRTKRNLSYAPTARHSWSGEVARGSLYVTAVKANKAIEVMFHEVRKLQSKPVPEKVLRGAKSVFITSHLMGNEATDGQASWLAICDIIGGDFRLATALPERIKKVTAEQVQAFARKFIGNLQTVVLGDPSAIDEELFQSL